MAWKDENQRTPADWLRIKLAGSKRARRAAHRGYCAARGGWTNASRALSPA
jgi:hypothetical protein